MKIQKDEPQPGMKTFRVTLKSMSPYSQGRYYSADHPKLEKESHEDYEQRTWMKRLHINESGHVFIPPLAFKNCLSEAAKYLSIQIPGEGKSTYTKHIEAGVLVVEPLVLPQKEADVKGQWMHVPADGRRGGPKRVMKCFPVIPEWSGDVDFIILDSKITSEVFRRVLEEAGKFIGIGSFRPRNNSIFGRFAVVGIKEI